MSTTKEIVLNTATGSVSVEESNDSVFEYNLGDIVTAKINTGDKLSTLYSKGNSLNTISTLSSTETTLPVSLEDLPTASKSKVETRPVTNSSTVYLGKYGSAIHFGPGDIVGNGHLVGVFGLTDNKSTGTVAGAYGVEGRIHASNGHQTFTASMTAAVQGQSEGAGGTIGIHTDYYSPLLSDHSHIVVKYCLLNSDPNKILKTEGNIEMPGGRVIPRNRVGVAASRYYPIEGVNALYAGTALTRGVLWACPLVVHDTATYTRIGFTLGTGIASNTARLGIYKDNAGVPDSLVLDAGTVTCDPGDVGTREITISQKLFPGIYWVCIQSEGGASDPAITWAGVNAYNIVGMLSPTSNDTVAFVGNTGALPASFGSASFGGGGFSPFLWLRVI